MERTDVIQAFIDGRQLSTYLEIGVSSGHSFLRVRAQRKIGVEPRPRIGALKWLRWWIREASNRRSVLIRSTSEAFFAAPPAVVQAEGIDIAFVDGLHTYEQALADVEGCLRHLNPGGVVLMHDCSPPSAAAATRASSPEDARGQGPEGWDGTWCGDVYKAILHLRAQRSDLQVCVLDCDRGIGIVQPGVAATVLDLTPEAIQDLGYRDLERHRGRWLDLRGPESLPLLVGR